MPSKSKSQAKLMAAVAHNPEFAKKVGIPVSVGKEFNKADKGRKFKEGGTMKHEDIKQDKAMVKKAVSMHDKQLHGGKKTDLAKLNGGGMARMASKGEHSVQKQSKRGAEMVKMAKGGLASGHKSADGCAVRGKTRGTQTAMCGGGMAKGKK